MPLAKQGKNQVDIHRTIPYNESNPLQVSKSTLNTEPYTRI